MKRSEIRLPLVQRAFEFSANEMWRQLPAKSRDECQRLIVQQLKSCLQSEHPREVHDERQNPC